MSLHSHAKDVVDAGLGLAVLGSLFNHAPEIAAVLGCIWYVIRIVDYFRLRRANKDTSGLID